MYYAGGPASGMPGYYRYQLGLATAANPAGPWTKHGEPLLPLGESDNFHTTPTLLRGENNEVLWEDGETRGQNTCELELISEAR